MMHKKRNLFLIYPGMNPGRAMFEDYIEAGRAQRADRDLATESSRTAETSTVRFIPNLTRRVLSTRVSA